MMDNELLVNYKKALNQKYNAVCLDIDGTITDNNSINVSEKFLPLFAEILKRKIPVLFITGRGESGINELKINAIEKLKSEYEISGQDLSRIYALTNDGARLFISSSEEVFCNNTYMVGKDKLDNMNLISIYLEKLINRDNVSKYCKLVYSLDSKTNQVINIRVLIHNNHNQIKDLILEEIYDIIDKLGIHMNVSVGVYKSDETIQVGIAKKSEAIKHAERLIGVPENSMIRVGDCGDLEGNDYSMLDCPQGFSVDKTSGKKDVCFPVLDANNNVLKGVDATIYLLQKAKILPAICLEHAHQDDYTKSYSLVEKRIERTRKNQIVHYDELVNKIFDEYDGIDGLYDSKTGSVKIKMYDWEVIDDNNPLKRFWNDAQNQSYKYLLKDDDSILLRESQTYYYLIAYRESIYNLSKDKEEDITSKQTVINWLSNYTTFFEKALVAIKETADFEDKNNKKMILGIIDNIRNYLLINLNQRIKTMYENKNLMLNLESLEKETLEYMFYEKLLVCDKIMEQISFNDNYSIDKDELTNILNEVIKTSYITTKEFINSKNKDNYSKDFRAYREIDNFAENYITCNLSVASNKENYDTHGVCGLAYGGIELAIIQKVLNNNLSDVAILKFNDAASSYSKKQTIELRLFDVYENGGIDILGVDKSKKYVLLDDNLLTGKTIQMALNIMEDTGINVDEVDIVRYPSINRVSQMFLPNHGAVNYNLFFDYINGLCFPSPYSYKDPHSMNPYEDSLGVFDLNRKKINECLLKNNDYNVNSEVSNYKRKK